MCIAFVASFVVGTSSARVSPYVSGDRLSHVDPELFVQITVCLMSFLMDWFGKGFWQWLIHYRILDIVHWGVYLILMTVLEFIFLPFSGNWLSWYWSFIIIIIIIIIIIQIIVNCRYQIRDYLNAWYVRSPLTAKECQYHNNQPPEDRSSYLPKRRVYEVDASDSGQCQTLPP
jgi:hypothetical protein